MISQVAVPTVHSEVLINSRGQQHAWRLGHQDSSSLCCSGRRSWHWLCGVFTLFYVNQSSHLNVMVTDFSASETAPVSLELFCPSLSVHISEKKRNRLITNGLTFVNNSRNGSKLVFESFLIALVYCSLWEGTATDFNLHEFLISLRSFQGSHFLSFSW